MGKIGLCIGGRTFYVKVEDEFSVFFEQKIKEDFNLDNSDNLKTLLNAYVKKNLELYEQEKKMNSILKNLDEKHKI
ncbi:MAG: hypothetical protein U9N02_00535 [Campylobacterota bacterium]|nr:hypothetical protein [Campylobacterota bacterium]